MKVIRAALFGIGLCTILTAPCGAADPETATPLVVGSVRDSLGNPIIAAAVTARSADGSSLATVKTDASGTFALPGDSAARDVSISCRFCRSVTAHIPPNGPVVVIVKRYQALLNDALSQNDISALPYSHVEEALALKPFTVLRESQTVLPGPSVSDRGLGTGNSLILESGVPVYDVTSGNSSFYDFPARWAGALETHAPSSAFSYGDQAGAGTISIASSNDEPGRAAASAGDDAGILFVGHSGISETSFGESASARDNVLRLDSSAIKRYNNTNLRYDIAGAQTVLRDNGDDLRRHVFLGRLGYVRNFEKYDVLAEFSSDRGAFTSNSFYSKISDQWSNINTGIRIETKGTVSLFAGARLRRSNGSYEHYAGLFSELRGRIQHEVLYAGARTSGQRIDAFAGLGLDHVAYSGGINGTSTDHVSDILATPSLNTTLQLGKRFSGRLDAVSSFRLPTLFERYGEAPTDTLIYNRNSSYSGTVQFTDSARIRAQVTAFRQVSHGLTNGALQGAGAAVAWQITPLISLRGWLLRLDDRTTPYNQLPSTPARAQTVGATWLTYENNGRLRIDMIDRRNLIGNVAENNIDGAMSVPVTDRSELFLATDRRHQVRYWNLGLRTQP